MISPMAKPLLISVVGPTAIGKTSLSIEIANHFKTEIVSTDSRQFYKEMRIGTAVPSLEELNSAPHHFIQHLSVNDSYSVGEFETDAMTLLHNLFKRHSCVVAVGGSGLYMKAITEGFDDFPELDPSIRVALNDIHKKKGLLPLQKELKLLDPDSFKSIDLNNPQRLIRALEVSKGTGIPFSRFKTEPKKERFFDVLTIGLTADRNIIYDRINKRVDLMVDNGLIEEVKSLYEFKNLNALNTVGYKEVFEYLDNKLTLEEAIEKIKMNTRRFAKRQLTWYRKDNSINWFNYPVSSSNVLAFVNNAINN